MQVLASIRLKIRVKYNLLTKKMSWKLVELISVHQVPAVGCRTLWTKDLSNLYPYHKLSQHTGLKLQNLIQLLVYISAKRDFGKYIWQKL